MMVDQLVRTMLLALKSSDEFEVFPPEERKRLEEIIAFVGGEEIDELFDRLESVPEALYQLKVTLRGSKPPIWRRIIVPSDFTFSDLHDVIQTAMGWMDMHLYSFEVSDILVEEEYEDDPFGGFSLREKMDAETTLIGELLSKEGDKGLYMYDFGDDWHHTVLLEKVLPFDDSFTSPVCIKGKRACPPEDCGGVYGYENLLEILNGPDGGEKEELLEWVGDNFDPEAFDIDMVNEMLAEEF
ncbi:plasmid pRiA4b ORF-3 family protein [Psychrobacillus sp. NPDC093180]|uniref:plasmid pRiA4b ORF-3 family protein n=1 Tax=Psychrobacillus sp. NPDC093180 TaxID=3364489 RepID=UPI0037FA0B8E